MSKKYVIAAVAAPFVAWAAIVVVGRKRADTAGLAVFNDRGFLLPFKHGGLIESMAAGVLVTYLVKG